MKKFSYFLPVFLLSFFTVAGDKIPFKINNLTTDSLQLFISELDMKHILPKTYSTEMNLETPLIFSFTNLKCEIFINNLTEKQLFINFDSDYQFWYFTIYKHDGSVKLIVSSKDKENFNTVILNKLKFLSMKKGLLLEGLVEEIDEPTNPLFNTLSILYYQ